MTANRSNEVTKVAVASPSFCEHPKLRAELLARYAMGRIAIVGIEDNFVPVPGQFPFVTPVAGS